MIGRQEVGGITWYIVSRRFETADAAKTAWNELQAEDERLHCSLQLGVYRHGPDEAGAEANMVTAVTHDWHGAEVAEQMLDAGSTESGLEPELREALVLRRIDMLAAQIDAGQGTVKIRRPEGRGARVYPGGIFEEQIGHDE